MGGATPHCKSERSANTKLSTGGSSPALATHTALRERKDTPFTTAPYTGEGRRERGGEGGVGGEGGMETRRAHKGIGGGRRTTGSVGREERREKARERGREGVERWLAGRAVE